MSHLKVQAWGEAEFRQHLVERLAYAKDYRKQFEDTWAENEQFYYNNVVGANAPQANVTPQDYEADQSSDDMELDLEDVAINYISRDIRYMHAQMSANPPTVKVIPTSTDLDDEERADAADIVCRWARAHYKADEVHDQRNLKTLTKGTGYLRYPWDATLGKIMSFDEETGELVMSGDIRLYSPSTWDIWLDPDARCPDTYAPDGIKWYFEKITMPTEEAIMRWPHYAEKLREASSGAQGESKWRFWDRKEKQNKGRRKQVEVFLYVERGEAVNGMKGRQAYMLEDGTLLDFGANEHPNAWLGLDVLTDIDVEDEPYGKSVIEYLGPVQAMIQSLDANTLRNIAAHAVVRMYIDGNTTLSDDALGNDALDIIKGEGGNPPIFLNPPSQMADAWKLRDQLHNGSREISMINEAMLGQASRETSGYTTQLQVNQGSLGRRRLFNKFTASVKNMFTNVLALIMENWEEDRQIQVLGKERAYEVYTFRNTDLQGGWDLIAEYGQNFSLDPNTARDQILQLMPLFEKIEGFDYRWLVDAIRLNVMDNFIDRMALARRKQRRIFKEMILNHDKLGSAALIQPKDLEDHKHMLEYARAYVMTEEFDALKPDTRALIEQHIKLRETMLANTLAAANQPNDSQSAAGIPSPPPAIPGLAPIAGAAV